MTYTLIETVEEANELAFLLKDKPDTVFTDIESTGLNWFKDDILLFQIMHQGVIYIVDVRKVGYNTLKFLVSILKKESKCIFHNAKFDIKFIYDKTGILLENIFDTMTCESILNAGIGKKLYSLSDLAEKYAGIFMEKDSRKDFIDFPKNQPFTETMLNYSALDVKALEPIYNEQMEKVIEAFESKVVNVDMKLLPIVAKMEYDGIGMDIKLWLEVERDAIIIRDKLTEEFNKEIVDFLVSDKTKVPNALELSKKFHLLQKNKYTKKITAFLEQLTELSQCRGWIEQQFNVKSPAQLLAIFNGMGIKCKNTNEKTLENFRKYPIIDRLLAIREVNKQIDQYGSNFLKNLNPITGKIHTEYFTVGTATGRFSSSKPNLQNIPTHGRYRECFIPEEDFLFAIVDYSQQEYRLAGAISNESVIINAYKSGSDMHTATGKIVAKKEQITQDERNRGKTVNFAILYGSTEWGLKRNLKIKIEEAKEIINSFWKGYPKLSKFMQVAGERILELGYSSTPLGRRRYNVDKPKNINSDEYVKWQQRILREGRNHIIQGGGADILKLAIVKIWEENPYGDKLRLTLQIHDEIVVQVHKSIAEEALEYIKRIMIEAEQPFLGEIPAEVEGKLKPRWCK